MWQAAIPLALSGAQAIFGAVQASKGKNTLDNAERPEYKIPDEVLKNLSVAERMALQGLPDAQKKAYVDQINQGMATSLRGLSSRKAGISGVSKLSQSQNQAYQNLLSMDAQARQENERLAMSARSDLAGYKDKAFQVNQMEPYEQKVAEGQALYGAGLQNIFAGVNTAGGVGQMAMGTPRSSDETDTSTTTLGPDFYQGVENIYNKRKKPYPGF